MKKIMFVAAMALAIVSCGGANEKADSAKDSAKAPVAKEVKETKLSEDKQTVVEQPVATDVLPAAAPGADAAGKVATDVVPAK